MDEETIRAETVRNEISNADAAFAGVVGELADVVRGVGEDDE